MSQVPFRRWALLVGAATLLLLVVPLVAMQFTAQVRWAPGDFIAAGAMLFAAGMTYPVVSRVVRRAPARIAVTAVVLVGLAAVWAELAVGLFD